MGGTVSFAARRVRRLLRDHGMESVPVHLLAIQLAVEGGAVPGHVLHYHQGREVVDDPLPDVLTAPGVLRVLQGVTREELQHEGHMIRAVAAAPVLHLRLRGAVPPLLAADQPAGPPAALPAEHAAEHELLERLR